MILVSASPASTPTKLDNTNAPAEPANTNHGARHSAAKSIVASWVLSPSSAKNTKVKAFQNKMQTPHYLINCPLEILSLDNPIAGCFSQAVHYRQTQTDHVDAFG